MTEASTPPEPELKSLRDRPFELLAQLERRGRAVSAQVSQEEAAGREWVGVALRGERVLRGCAAHGGALRTLSRRRISPRPGAMAGALAAPGARESRVH